MTWHKIELSADDVIAGKEIEIVKVFTQAFVAASGPTKDAAMFTTRLNSPGATIYLSPGAVRIAQTLIANYSGVPCDCPPKSVGLLIGEDNAGNELLG